MSDISKKMAESDDLQINFHPHYVKILRELANDIESGKEVGVTGSVNLSRDNPGISVFVIVTKKSV